MSSSSTSAPGRSEIRAEVLAVIREWLTEADEISYHFGGTYASVLAEALVRLEQKEADAATQSSPERDVRPGDVHVLRDERGGDG
jgi:hypothetical protein